ncbi:MAG: carboxypeptidase-like regulatory domain-containing protein [Draconibacterium sp.]
MKKNKKHIVFDDFRRYRADEMTPEERNAFEKELQKDPFLADALEGMEQLSAEEMSQQVHELSTQISSPGENRKIRFVAAAASILILISIGILWLQINKQDPIPELTQAKKTEASVKEQEEKIIPLTEPGKELDKSQAEQQMPIKPDKKEKSALPKTEEVTRAKSAVEKKELNTKPIANKKAEKPIELLSARAEGLNAEVQDTLQAKSISNQVASGNRIMIRGMSTIKSDQTPENVNVFRGKIISAENKKPLPGATITVLGTTRGVISDIDGNFTIQLNDSDSSLVASFIGMENKILSRADGMNSNIELEPKDQGLEQVTVVGFGRQKKETVVGSMAAIGSNVSQIDTNKTISSSIVLKGLASDRSNPITANMNIFRGKVISAADKQPLPGVSIIEKGTINGIITDINGDFVLPFNDSAATFTVNFVGMESKVISPADSMDAIIELEPDQLALDEVVAVGYGVQKHEHPTGSVSSVNPDWEIKNQEAEPVSGYKAYYEYLESKAILPPNYPNDKEVVKLRIQLNGNGEIKSIENLNRADKRLFEKAKQIVLNGPAWKPELLNNKKVVSSVKLRIVFRKEK